MDEVTLIWSEDAERDDDGFKKKTTTHEETIPATEKSVRRTEFYEARRSGISTKFTLEVRTEDFELSAHLVNGKKEYAKKARYDGGLYDIIRTYGKGKPKTELVCG